MATYLYSGFAVTDIIGLSNMRLRVNPAYDSASAPTFGIVDDDGTWSGDSVINSNADDTSGQITTVHDPAGTLLASGRSYLEFGMTLTDENGTVITLYQVQIGGTTVGYVADGPLQPGNTYAYTTSNVTPANAPSYDALQSQTYDPDAANAIQGTGTADSLSGWAGDDTIDGGDGNDLLSGGAGNDHISGGRGNDTLHGGDGSDTFAIADTDGTDVITGGNGATDIDAVVFSVAGSGSGVAVTFTGSEAGSYDFLGSAGAGTFTQIEEIRGTALNDTVDARLSDAAQVLSGGGGHDVLLGGRRGDTLEGGAGDDTLSGGLGHDIVQGGSGSDDLYGGDGRDTLEGGASGDVIHGDAIWLDPADHASGSDADAPLLSIGSDLTIEINLPLFGGGSSVTPTTLTVINGADAPIELWWIDPDGIPQFYRTLDPGGTCEQPTFEEHNWILRDEDGNDLRLIEAARETSVTYGGEGLDDAIDGGDADDLIHGQFGDDTLHGGQGDDTLHGGSGADLIDGGAGDDAIHGGSGNDTVDIAAGADTVHGDDGADLIRSLGSDFDKLVYGGEGGTDGDTLSWAQEEDATDGVSITFTGHESGIAAIRGRTVTFSEIETVELTRTHDLADASATTGGVHVLGLGGNDRLIGGSGHDTLLGGAGADTIHGGDGDDYIEGGDGDDFLTTGLGRDTLIGGDGNDTLMNSDGDDSLVGGAGDDSIVATGGNDTLEGGDGDDTLDGGADDDSIIGSTGNDVILTGTGNDHADGGDDSDTFIVADGFGDDTLLGGEGGADVDTIDLSALSESVTVLHTGAEAGTITNGIDAVTFGEIERLVLTDQSDIVDATADTAGLSVDLGAGDDTIASGSGADTIDGGAGDDVIDGGAGDDLLRGGSGNDTFVAGADGSHDTILDFNAGNIGALGDGDRTNNDFIDLSAYYTDLFELRADFDDDGILNQSAGDHDDDTSLLGGSLTFSGAVRGDFTEDSTGVVCFAGGTPIRTPRGDVTVESLAPGDAVCIWDGRIAPVIWVGRSDVALRPGMLDRRRTPVRLKRADERARALLVSPQHCMLMSTPDGRTAFARARHLAEETTLASFARGRASVSYHHVLLTHHEILLAAGRPSESFYPGPSALAMMDASERKRLIAAVPALETAEPALAYGSRAAEVLRRRDVKRLAAQGRLAFAVGAHQRRSTRTGVADWAAGSRFAAEEHGFR